MQIAGFFCHSDFTWNQFWRILKLQNCHFCTFRGSEFWFFMTFCTFWRLELTKLTKFRALKWPKMAFLEPLDSLTLISRKIWVTEKTQKFAHCENRILSKNFVKSIGETRKSEKLPFLTLFTWNHFLNHFCFHGISSQRACKFSDFLREINFNWFLNGQNFWKFLTFSSVKFPKKSSLKNG